MNSTRTSTRNRTALAGLAGAILCTTLAAAPAAQAAPRDGICDPGEFCLYFNSNQKGSVSDFTTSVPDYGTKQPGCFEFRGSGKGKRDCVKNSAASAWNRTSQNVTVFFNSNYGGTSMTYGFGSRGNLSPALKNQNASHRIGKATPPSTGGGGGGGNTGGGGGGGKLVNMSFALYNASGGQVTAGFDGYKQTSGKHEGIDIAKGAGSSIRALTSGTVTNVSERAGKLGLSTIAIYNASYNKTVIYLHSNPKDGLRGKIKKGQLIGTESNRGAPGGVHTHVEVRNGRQTNAEFSSDNVLKNPNPTAFWKARGYAIR